MDRDPDDSGPRDDYGDTRGPDVVAAFTTMFAAASVAVGLRMYTRVKFLHGLKVEDWLILGAWVRLSHGISDSRGANGQQGVFARRYDRLHTT